MPTGSDDMEDLDRPATKRDLFELQAATKRDFLELATKADLRALEAATKDDIRALGAATKDDLRALEAATKDDLRILHAATKDDLRALQAATRDDLRALEAATKDDLSALRALDAARQRDLRGFEENVNARFDELHRHFDVAIESFKTEFASLYDWTLATTSSVGQRVTRLETDHGRRLRGLETRVTRLEKRRK